MTQLGIPEADITVSGWTASAGGNLYGTVDEAVADDADYFYSAEGPQDSPVVLRLSDLQTPAVRTGHILWVRCRWANGSGTWRMELRQGYVSEASQGTLINSATPTVSTTTFDDETMALSAGEATAITDYTNLFVRIVADT